MELSAATTANWVSKSANLLVDGLASPERIGLLLPLHWQSIALLLAGVATGATVVVAAEPGGLAGCGAAFVLAGDAESALDAGVNDVLALSGHPLGLPAGELPAMVLDYAREVPSYADHFGGPVPRAALVEVAGLPLAALDGFSPGDRVLTALPLHDQAGAAVIAGALAAGASLVLLTGGDATAVAAAERVTATAGTAVEGLERRA